MHAALAALAAADRHGGHMHRSGQPITTGNMNNRNDHNNNNALGRGSTARLLIAVVLPIVLSALMVCVEIYALHATGAI